MFAAADRVERIAQRRAAATRHTDLYSPDRKGILGREHKKRDGETQLIKLDRVSAITNWRHARASIPALETCAVDSCASPPSCRRICLAKRRHR